MASMMETMINAECERKLFPTRILHELKIRVYTDNSSSVTFSVKITMKPTPIEDLLSASHVSNCKMAENDFNWYSYYFQYSR